MSFKKYIRFYLISIAVCCFPLGLNYVFLRNAGELYDSETIYKLQNTPNKNLVLYGSAIFDDIHNLKLYSYNQKKPKIVAFGSSRVLQLREAFFTKKFYNLGYTFSSISNGLATSDKLLDRHVPEVIILGVDPFWFNENYLPANYYSKGYLFKENKFLPQYFLKPFQWLKQNKISWSQYWDILLKSNASGHIGIQGLIQKSGIAKDGSAYYTHIVTGKNLSEFKEANFMQTKSDIKKDFGRFAYSNVASSKHIEKFLEIIQNFQNKGIKVILFMTPFPPEINRYMKDFNYNYIEDLKSKFESLDVLITDFTEPQKLIDTCDCEFLDGFHGGDVVYAKILNYLTAQYPVLENYVDVEKIRFFIDSYSGLAMIPDERVTDTPEVDFLELGCSKSIKKNNQ